MTVMRVIGIQGANHLYAMCSLTVNDNSLPMLATSSKAKQDILHNHPMVTSLCLRMLFQGSEGSLVYVCADAFAFDMSEKNRA